MLPEITKLLVVQHRDQTIKALEKKIANIPVEEEDIRDRLSTEKKAVEAALADVQSVEVEIKNIELDVQTRRDSIAKLKVQQFETKKNEEFQAMGKEIERYEEEIATLEDQEIELMEKLEGLTEILDSARGVLSESEESVESDIADLHQTKANWEKEMAEEKSSRSEAISGLDEDLVSNYERIFNAKNGKAVVGLTDGQCTGCHMKVVKSTVVAVKAANELTHCENCGRMLYWWTDAVDNESGTSNEY